MGSIDLITFAQALYPCLKANYPQLISGITQLVGGASVVYALFNKFAPSTTAAGSTSPFKGLLSLISKIGLNP